MIPGPTPTFPPEMGVYLYCRDIGLFCGDIGLFSGGTGFLSRVDTWSHARIPAGIAVMKPTILPECVCMLQCVAVCCSVLQCVAVSDEDNHFVLVSE